MLEFAKRGAELRFRDLVHEARNLIALFPHLRDSFDADELPLPFIIAEGARQTGGLPARARKRRMSPAARKATSERMTRYWAEQRKANKT